MLTTKLKKRTAPYLIILLLISGCASQSNFRLSDAALAGDPSAMWKEGQKSVDTGEALVANGENRLTAGRKQVREGEAMIRSGNQDVLLARNEYQDAAAAGGASLTPKQVAAEAKGLQIIGDRWEDSIKKIRRGNELVDKGNRSIDKGQSEIREGRALMESGSDLMRNSQRSRLGQKMLPSRAE